MWLEIDFGREITAAWVEVKGEEPRAHTFLKGWAPVDKDQSFSFRVMVPNGEEWVEAGSWEKSGIDKRVDFEPLTCSRIRISIMEGQKNGVSIPEILIFDQDSNPLPISEKYFTVKTNKKGGKAFFMPVPQVETLRTILNEAQAVWDIRIEGVQALSDGGLSYLHKTQGGRDIYFFANSSDTPVNSSVLIRGNLKLESWDPQTGEVEKCNTSTLTQNGTDITRFQLTLDPVKSLFFVSKSLNHK